MAKGFGGIPGNMQGILKQAQKMKEQIEKTQEAVESFELESQAGGGMVKVRMNGKFRVVSIEISKEVINPEDPEMLQDLIRAACNEAAAQIHDHTKNEMSKVTGGLSIPGLL